MSEIERRSTSNEETGTVAGEIVGVEETRVRVRLDGGSIGFVARAEAPDPEATRVGERAEFRVIASAEDGTLTLAFAGGGQPVAEEPFERDVVRLHNALANHRPSNSVRPPERIHLGEEQIGDWIDSVEASISRIRKNRTKRLDEEFYNS